MNRIRRNGKRPLSRHCGLAGLAAGTATLLMMSGTALAADLSSFAESRGYQNCVDAAKREVQLVKVEADYFIYDSAESRRFYLNGHGFRNGDIGPVKIACDTTPSGNRLLGVSVDGGQYAALEVEPVNVARN